MSAIESKEDIVRLLSTHKDELVKFGVKSIGLFGSFLKGLQNDESDIDLVVEFTTDKKTFRNFMHLAFFLEELLQRKVEVITPESISPYMKPSILKETEYVLQ